MPYRDTARRLEALEAHRAPSPAGPLRWPVYLDAADFATTDDLAVAASAATGTVHPRARVKVVVICRPERNDS